VLNARLVTWWRAWGEILAGPHGELNRMARKVGREGIVSSRLSLSGLK
jgi:hypothetical protein